MVTVGGADPPVGRGAPGVCAPLVIETLPDAVPAWVGVKIVVKVALCPVGSISGSAGPATAKPLPVATACVTVRAEVPEFVSVRLCLLLEPSTTFPKLRVLGLAARFPDDDAQPDWVRAAKKTDGKRKTIVR